MLRFAITRCSSLAVAVCCVALLAIPKSVRAEVSPQDGYGPGGAYQVHVELAPYLWLPATSSTVNLGNGASKTVSAGVPSLSQALSALNGAFIGFGLVRYGPWSGELDIQYVAASASKGLSPDVFGLPRSLQINSSLVRVAPGIGYEVFNRSVWGIPTVLDARVGFAYFTSTITLDLDRTGLLGQQRLASVSGGGDFVQPWTGLRAGVYPWPRWRFELGALVQGFGISGGVWGWGASATVTWAANRWLNLVAGYRALSSARDFASRKAISSLHLTEYGPVFGVEVTF